jgi:hypothetical protein
MPANPTTQRMGELHEIHLAEINHGTKTKSSGNQWHDQGDGRNTHDEPFAFCWDGKSTRGKQIAVTLDMIAKIREQAQGERPQIGLRWYGNDALDIVLEDWIAVTDADFEEMKLAAIRVAELETQVADLIDQAAMTDSLQDTLGKAEEDNTRLRRELDEAQEAEIGLRTELGEVRDHRDSLREENERLRQDLEIATEQRDLEGRNALRLAADVREVQAALVQAREAVAAASGPGDTVQALQEILHATVADRDRWKELAEATRRGKLIPPYVPRMPWTVVYQVLLSGRTESAGLYYDDDGRITPFTVSTVRIERSFGPSNRPRLIVNDHVVRDGDLYISGKLMVRACTADPSIETG